MRNSILAAKEALQHMCNSSNAKNVSVCQCVSVSGVGGKARERTHLLTVSTHHMSLIKLVQRADVGQIYAVLTSK
jgi:hypothetical protein